MKILVSIFFMLLSMAGISQVYQRQTAPFEFTRGIKQDTVAVIPRGCDTVALPRMKFGAPTIGALYYDTCANTLYVKDSWGWMPVTGGLDSAAFAPVIDSTGQRSFRVLFAVNNKIYGSDKFTYDSLLNYLLITGKVEADSLIINGGAEFIGSTYIDDLEAYNLRVTNTAAVYDTTNYKIGVINTSTGRVERFAYWPANGGGGDYVDTIYRKPGRDSIYYKINGGAERAIKDSIGGGGSGVYVPYEGATRKVRLTDYGLLTDFVDFDLTPVNADTTGRLNWDSAAGTLEVHLKGNNVHLQIGQEQVILVRNNTGSPLTDGQIVYITGSTGEVPTVALANNKTFTIASRTLGMVTEPIAHGQQGYITITGIVNGLNTNALTEGAAIWLDSLNGAYTQSQPASPYNDVLLGYVVKKSGGNGSIFVKAQNILDRNYTDSVVGLRLRIADTVGMRAKEVLSFAKNAARDSAILTLFDGTRFPVRDSIGGGGGTPGGSTYSIQYNRAGAFAGNSNFVYDTVNARVGLGTGSPVSRLTVVDNIITADRGVNFFQVGANIGAALFQFSKQRGTYASPSAIFANDFYGALSFKAHDGTDFIQLASLSVKSNSTVGTNNIASEMSFAISNDNDPGASNKKLTLKSSGLHEMFGSLLMNDTLKITRSSANSNPLQILNNTSTSNAAITFLHLNNNTGNIGAIGTASSNYALVTGWRSNLIISSINSVVINGNGNSTGSASTYLEIKPGGYDNSDARARFYRNGTIISDAQVSSTPAASAVLELVSTTRGFLPPRLTTTQRNAIASPATGLNLYNTSTSTNDVNTAAGWYQQPNGLTGSGTLDFPNTLAQTSSDLTITVTGAAVGDIVILGTPVQGANSTFTAFVSAANTVTVRMNNYSALAIDPASAAFKVYVIKN
jgi:hypothetical protein